MAALLHDVQDNKNNVTSEDVQKFAGENVAALVSDVARLSRANQLCRRVYRHQVEAGNYEEAQKQNHLMTKMILQMTNEPLTTTIKLADRLHNLRTSWALEPKKAGYIARETLDVWCPQCEYLGLNAVKAELEDLCFVINDATTFKQMHYMRDEMLKNVPQQHRHVRSSAACVTLFILGCFACLAVLSVL